MYNLHLHPSISSHRESRWVIEDVWVMDDRDDSPERGEWNPDPDEATSWSGRVGRLVVSFFWMFGMLDLGAFCRWRLIFIMKDCKLKVCFL